MLNSNFHPVEDFQFIEDENIQQYLSNEIEHNMFQDQFAMKSITKTDPFGQNKWIPNPQSENDESQLPELNATRSLAQSQKRMTHKGQGLLNKGSTYRQNPKPIAS